MRRLVLTTGFVLIYGILLGQSFPRVNISMEDGLPSNTVYDVFQDTKGFVWVATENGLAKFNGATFQTIPGKNLKSLAVANIIEDSQGGIWCINFSGQVLRVRQDTLSPLEAWNALGEVGFPKLIAVQERILILKQTDLWTYDIAEDSLIHFDPQSPILRSIAPGTGEAWVSYSDKEIIRIPADKKTRPKQAILPISIEVPGSPVLATLANDRVFLTFVKKKIYKIDSLGKSKNITPLFNSLNLNFRSASRLDSNRVIFFGSDGVVILDSELKLTHLLPGENIGSAVMLSEGGLLVGTLNKGLFLIPTLKSKLQHTSTGNGLSKLAYDSVNLRIVAGDLGGNVLFYNRKLEEVNQAKEPSSTSAIQSILIDYERNRIFAQSNQLLEFQLDHLTLVRRHRIFTVKQMIAEDTSYYMATSFGLLHFSVAELTNEERFFEKTRTTSLTQVSDSLLIIGSQRGTLIFNLNKKQESERQLPIQSETSILTSTAKYQDLYIFGTAAQGIFICNEQLEPIRHIKAKDGLLSDQINSLSISGHQMAIATNNGVNLLDLKTWQIESIDRTDGLFGYEVADVLLFPDSLIVATSALQYFDLPLRKQSTLPSVHIGKIEIDGNITSSKNGSYFIPYGINELVIAFDVSHSIQDLGKSQIFYRLKELQKSTWNNLPLTSPQARLLSLPSGKYTLEAYARNSKGLTSEKIQIPIEVETPFWLKPWFQALSYLLGALFVVVLVFLYFRRANRKKQGELIRSNRAQQLRIAQLTSIRAQMNPHFIFNTMTMIQGLVLKGEPKPAGKTIQEFSKLMRSVLELSSEEFITLEAEIKIIERYLEIEKQRFDGQLNFSIEIDPEIISESIRIPSLLTQPYVENALRHGLLHKEGEKRLTISLQLEEEFLNIFIEDNGIGRKAAQEIRKKQLGKSFALEAYQKRIDLLNANSENKIQYHVEDLYNEKNQPAGTRIQLKVPFDYGS